MAPHVGEGGKGPYLPKEKFVCPLMGCGKGVGSIVEGGGVGFLQLQ